MGKTEARRDVDAHDNERLLRFVFMFWGSYRQSLATMGWRELSDRRNTTVQEETPEMGFSAIVADKNSIKLSAIETYNEITPESEGNTPDTRKSSSRPSSGGYPHKHHGHRKHKHSRHTSPSQDQKVHDYLFPT